MRMTRRARDRSDFEIVVTSMLDINFLLIMFFMMTAHFQRTTHAHVNLPQEQGEKQPQVDEAGLVINITAEGNIIISGQTIDLEELRSRVKTELNKLPVPPTEPLKLMIRADKQADAQHLNRVVSM